MLFVLFQIGKDRYALAASDIVQVLPMVELKGVPCAPPTVAGLFDYHGTPVPVIDLTQCLANRSSRPWLSSRIILVKYAASGDEVRTLGLLAERAVEVFACELKDFVEGGVVTDGTPYLGRVVRDPRGLIQWVHPANLLPESIRNLLFREALEVCNAAD
jgi:chemotaxis-related protein WspB